MRYPSLNQAFQGARRDERSVQFESCVQRDSAHNIPQANEDISKNLQQIKAILLGDGGEYRRL